MNTPQPSDEQMKRIGRYVIIGLIVVVAVVAFVALLGPQLFPQLFGPAVGPIFTNIVNAL